MRVELSDVHPNRPSLIQSPGTQKLALAISIIMTLGATWQLKRLAFAHTRITPSPLFALPYIATIWLYQYHVEPPNGAIAFQKAIAGEKTPHTNEKQTISLKQLQAHPTQSSYFIQQGQVYRYTTRTGEDGKIYFIYHNPKINQIQIVVIDIHNKPTFPLKERYHREPYSRFKQLYPLPFSETLMKHTFLYLKEEGSRLIDTLNNETLNSLINNLSTPRMP